MMPEVTDNTRILQGLELLRSKILLELKEKLVSPGLGLDARIVEIHKASIVFNQLDALIDRLQKDGGQA